MRKAERICAGVDKKIKPQVVTLANAVLAMQKKIDQQIPIYEQLPLAQTLTTTQGEKALKQNPATQEFRATVRDYAAALNNLQDIIDSNKVHENVASLDAFRNKLRAVK